MNVSCPPLCGWALAEILKLPPWLVIFKLIGLAGLVELTENEFSLTPTHNWLILTTFLLWICSLPVLESNVTPLGRFLNSVLPLYKVNNKLLLSGRDPSPKVT